MVAAHNAAVDAAIGYLERAACFTRRGAGGAEQLPAGGFVAGAFRHRTSRADDPLLHTQPIPTDPLQQQDHLRHTAMIEKQRREVQREPVRERSRGLGRSR